MLRHGQQIGQLPHRRLHAERVGELHRCHVERRRHAHLLEQPQLLDVDERLSTEQAHFGLTARDLSLAHVDQRRLTDTVACLRELQKLFVALQRLLSQVSLRARL